MRSRVIWGAAGGAVRSVLGALALFVTQDAGPNDAVAGWLRERAMELPLEAAEDFPEPCFLAGAVDDARVVLLGEELHGVREFATLKARLVRHLVAQHGFDVVALEQDSLGCAELDAFVRGGEVDPARVLASFYWCWNDGDFLALLQWLRAHAARAARPVRFAGIDDQNTGRAAARLRALAAELALPDLAPSLAPFEGGRSAYQQLAEAARDEHANALAALGDALESSTVAKAAEPQREAAREALAILADVRALWSAPDAQARMNLRDRHMAERTRALLADEHARVVVWAHNAHALRARFYGGVEPLGSHLAAATRTLVVGVYFGSGEYVLDPRGRKDASTATIAAPPTGSLAETLAAARPGTWVADVRALGAAPPAVQSFFAAPPPGHFDNYGPAPSLAGALDFLLFVERVTPMRAP